MNPPVVVLLFGLSHSSIFLCSCAEIVVDKVFVKLHDVVNVKIVPPAVPPKPSADHTFAYTFMVITTLLCVFALYAEEGSVKQYFDVEDYCRKVDVFLLDLGIISKPGVALDSFIAIICWSVTYLYIRRLWNPETMDVAFPRFSADSFFGGLAAGGAVLLKAILVKILIEKK